MKAKKKRILNFYRQASSRENLGKKEICPACEQSYDED